jgi:prepilin signal peptidase PulO-like enzyme (type II secretory pathway)
MPLELRLVAMFAIGLLLGGFLNLAIYRLAYEPRAISPWSARLPAAPPRRLFDRLPVLGWIGLRREASLHGAGFWLRPLAIEIVTGSLLAALYWWEIGERGLLPDWFRIFLDLPPNAMLRRETLVTLHAVYLAHVCLIPFLLVASFIDLDEKTIPDAVTVPGTLIGLFLTASLPTSLLPIVIPGANGPAGVANPRLEVLTLAATGNWPWQSVNSLALGIGCLWLWCIGLMTRIWRPRRGWRIALRIFGARLVRDPMTKWLVILGLLGTAAIAIVWHFDGPHWQGLLTALVGMATGGLVIWVVRIVGSAVLGREAMGFGDVTLMAMIGTYLGWQSCFVVFFLAPFAGAAIGLAQWLTNRDPEIRFGPFLSLAAMVTIVLWADIWQRLLPVIEMGWIVAAILGVCLLLMIPLLIIVRAIGDWIRGRPAER